MSSYGNPPQDPYGQSGQPGQDPYGQPPAQPPYGQSPSEQPGLNPYPQPYGQQPYGYGAPSGGYAHWGKRVAALLIDTLIGMVFMIPVFIGAAMAGSDTSGGTSGLSGAGWMLTLLGYALYIAYFVWNLCIRQGRTGYSIGKGVMGIKLISENTGQPIGAGMSFVRQLAHILDQLPCYLGYLWPLWDAKRQTFADKILSTVVIDQPQG